MAVNLRVQRLLAGVRRWRSTGHDEPLAVHAGLSDGDVRRVVRLCDDIVETRGGEVTSRRRARQLGLTYTTLDGTGRRRFFDLLARQYGHDDDAVDDAIDGVLHARNLQDRRSAENDLRDALRPQRELILRRFVGLDSGMPFLVEMREDLLGHLADRERERRPPDSTSRPGKTADGRNRRGNSDDGGGGATVDALTDLDGDIRRILERWFDVAMLRLDRLTWDSPASLLEKLIEYEAVHAIGSWADLKARLGPGRRCYAFVHPAMPDDPLIFVEVAFTRGMADSVGPLIGAVNGGGSVGPRPTTTGRVGPGSASDPDSGTGELDGLVDIIDQAAGGRTGSDDREGGRTGAEPVDESSFDTAIFYSISNCHQGLAGVSLGDYLIKSVVEELSTELPNLKRFATLSPMPGFRSWLLDHLDRELRVRPSEPANEGADDDPETVHRRQLELVRELATGSLPPMNDRRLEQARPTLMALAADYIVNQRRSRRRTTGRMSTRAIDPVAHFHLSNGARAERLNWLANPSDVGWDRGLGMMINYRYELRWIEDNHDRYLEQGEISASDAVTKLLAPPAQA